MAISDRAQQTTDRLQKFMDKNKVTILIKNEMLTLDGISQFYINVEREEWKFATLIDLFVV